jgi:hypothetical protein
VQNKGSWACHVSSVGGYLKLVYWSTTKCIACHILTARLEVKLLLEHCVEDFLSSQLNEL